MIKDYYAKGLLFEQLILDLYSDEEIVKNYEHSGLDIQLEDFEYAIYNYRNEGYALGLLFNEYIVAIEKSKLLKQLRRFDVQAIEYIIEMLIYNLLSNNAEYLRLDDWTSNDFKEIDEYIKRQVNSYLYNIKSNLLEEPKTTDTIFCKGSSFSFGFENENLYIETKDFKSYIPNRLFYCIIDKNIRQEFIKSCIMFEYIKLRGKLWKK